MRPEFEAFLARLYTDADERERFLANRRGVAEQAGLQPHECRALDAIDRVGLELAARSFARKRQHATRTRRRLAWVHKLSFRERDLR